MADSDAGRRRLRFSLEKKLSAPQRASKQNYKVFATSPQRTLTLAQQLLPPLPNVDLERPSSQESGESAPVFKPMKRSGSPERRQKISEIENGKKRAIEAKSSKKVAFDDEVLVLEHLTALEKRLDQVCESNQVLAGEVGVLKDRVAKLETQNQRLQEKLENYAVAK